jgi:hypothetical protein
VEFITLKKHSKSGKRTEGGEKICKVGGVAGEEPK